MISFQKLFGKTDVFYGLLKASAEQASNSVQALTKLLESPNPGPDGLEEFRKARKKDKEITQQINEELVRSFVTELEREDVAALSDTLYRIPKTVEKVAERFLICGGRVPAASLSRQLKLLEGATSTVVAMVNGLCDKLHLESIKELNGKLQTIEGEADKVILALLSDLYAGTYSPMEAIMLKDLYQLMEKIIDRCRDTGNVVTGIVLKYS
jgi:uncharacterized protein